MIIAVVILPSLLVNTNQYCHNNDNHDGDDDDDDDDDNGSTDT